MRKITDKKREELFHKKLAAMAVFSMINSLSADIIDRRCCEIYVVNAIDAAIKASRREAGR